MKKNIPHVCAVKDGSISNTNHWKPLWFPSPRNVPQGRAPWPCLQTCTLFFRKSQAFSIEWNGMCENGCHKEKYRACLNMRPDTHSDCDAHWHLNGRRGLGNSQRLFHLAQVVHFYKLSAATRDTRK